MTGKSLIEVGVIAAAHGIRGEVKLRSFCMPPEGIFDCGALTDQNGKSFSLAKKGGNARGFIASIKGVTDRNEAEKLKGTHLYARRDALPKTSGQRLIGLAVKLADGTPYGTITGLFNFGAGDIIEIEKTDGKSEMLPLNKNFVSEIADDYIVIEMPEYLEAKK